MSTVLATQQAVASTQNTFMLFSLGHYHFCAPVDPVQSIILMPTIRRLPMAPKGVLGTFMFREKAALACDLAAVLNIQHTGNKDTQQLIVVALPEGLMAFHVDHVTDIVSGNDIADHISKDGADQGWLEGYVNFEEEKKIAFLTRFDKLFAFMTGRADQQTAVAQWLAEHPQAKLQVSASAEELPTETSASMSAEGEDIQLTSAMSESQGVPGNEDPLLDQGPITEIAETHDEVLTPVESDVAARVAPLQSDEIVEHASTAEIIADFETVPTLVEVTEKVVVGAKALLETEDGAIPDEPTLAREAPPVATITLPEDAVLAQVSEHSMEATQGVNVADVVSLSSTQALSSSHEDDTVQATTIPSKRRKSTPVRRAAVSPTLSTVDDDASAASTDLLPLGGAIVGQAMNSNPDVGLDTRPVTLRKDSPYPKAVALVAIAAVILISGTAIFQWSRGKPTASLPGAARSATANATPGATVANVVPTHNALPAPAMIAAPVTPANKATTAPVAKSPVILNVVGKDYQFSVERPSVQSNTVAQAITVAPGTSTPPAHTYREDISHLVKPGDTLWKIANQYLGDPYRYPELAKLSQIRDPNWIYPGDHVRIRKD
ncbi:MAG: chemotaxis protein CheW [Gammaproteobacteria bacterium]|nr:chemotaxis protein CheW [Gammaproteobacteria bacterium]